MLNAYLYIDIWHVYFNDLMYVQCKWFNSKFRYWYCLLLKKKQNFWAFFWKRSKTYRSSFKKEAKHYLIVWYSTITTLLKQCLFRRNEQISDRGVWRFLRLPLLGLGMLTVWRPGPWWFNIHISGLKILLATAITIAVWMVSQCKCVFDTTSRH